MISVGDKSKVEWNFINTASNEDIIKIEEILKKAEAKSDSKNYFIVEEKGQR
jgi:hypothetical protein